MTCFTLTKTEPLIACPANMPGPGAYYPTVVSMKEVEGFPFDYALYFSTDHQNTETGIWLYLCSGAPSKAENCTSSTGAPVMAQRKIRSWAQPAPSPPKLPSPPSYKGARNDSLPAPAVNHPPHRKDRTWRSPHSSSNWALNWRRLTS
jgi:hypothetical protein